MNTKQAIKKPINEGMPWEGISIPPRYDLRETGLFYEEPSETADDPPTYVFVSAPLWAVSRRANDLGRWSLQVAFVDHSGVVRGVDIKASDIHRARLLAGLLAESGLRVANEMLLKSYLLAANPASIVVDQRATEDEQLIERVKDFLITNQKKLQADGEFSPIERLGFLKGDEICLTCSAMERAAGDGRTATQIAKIVKRLGFLRTNDDRLQKKVNIGMGEVRLYCLRASILECDAQTLLTPISQFSTPISTENPNSETENPNSENAETRTSNRRTPKTTISYQSPETEKENPTNPIVTTIESSDIIAESYQASPAELDFQETMGGRNEPEDDDQTIEAEPDGWDVSNGEEDQDDDRSAALAAFIIEEGYPANRGGGLS